MTLFDTSDDDDTTPGRRPYASLPQPMQAMALRTHYALQALWTKAARDQGYDRSEWRELSNAISELITLIVSMADKLESAGGGA